MNAHPAVWVLGLAYDGSDFRGWQRQPGMRTVQGVLEAALASLTGEALAVLGASRTDAGVHARGQVAHFAQARPPRWTHPGESEGVALLDALRDRLPPSVRATRLRAAPASFHARASAIGKRYTYRFLWGGPDPSGAPSFDLGASASPDWERARAALRGLEGLEALPGLGSPSRDRRPAPPLESWELRQRGNVATLQVRAKSFRKHEIRNVSGHLAAIALGLAAPETLAALALRARPWMGATAPPHGLCLEEVFYPAEQDPFRPGG